MGTEELGMIKTGMLLSKRGFIVNTILFFAFFTSYFVLSYVVQEAFLSADIQASFNFVVAVSLLSASFFAQRLCTLGVMYKCSVITSAATGLLFLVSIDVVRFVLMTVTGVFFGIGQLAFLTYFWNSTVPEERGRIGGFIGFVSLPISFVVAPVLEGALDFLGTVILSIVFSLLPLAVILLKPVRLAKETKKNTDRKYFEKRTILLYSIPWILFSFINATLAKTVSLNVSSQVPSSFYFSLILLQVVASIIGALIGGIIADFFGRRLALTFSVTAYGVSVAFAGLIQNYAMYYLAYVLNGLSWGTLFTLYTFVIWGDLANSENSARMYSIGLSTFYVTASVGFLIPVSQIPLVVSSLVSILLIFLANLPLVLAPELLPMDFRDKIRMKLHLRKIRKIER
jgi:MFS family permease